MKPKTDQLVFCFDRNWRKERSAATLTLQLSAISPPKSRVCEIRIRYLSVWAWPLRLCLPSRNNIHHSLGNSRGRSSLRIVSWNMKLIFQQISRRCKDFVLSFRSPSPPLSNLILPPYPLQFSSSSFSSSTRLLSLSHPPPFRCISPAKSKVHIP